MLRSQAGVTYFGEHIFPELCVTEPVDCNFVAPGPPDLPRDQEWNNSDANNRNDTFDVQFNNRVEWFLPTPAPG